MTDTHELAWAAGFFDGEGCFATHGHDDLRYLTLTITQVDRRVLERFMNAVGAGRIYGPAVMRKLTHQPQYHFKIGARADIEAAANKLWPWLGPVKREQYLRKHSEHLSSPHRGKSGYPHIGREYSMTSSAIRRRHNRLRQWAIAAVAGG